MSQNPLDKWISRLQREELPAFTSTAQQVSSLMSRKDFSANDLAKIILQDGPLTTKLLRLVNSAYYNHSGKDVDTVSYAIVLLGVKKVSNLVLTVSLLESVATKFALSHVQKEMAYAYHAALLARALADHMGGQDTEHIYIAALLYRLGPLMFWCFPYDHGEALEQAYFNSMEGPTQIEKSVLGFSLDQLTNALIEAWGISPLLHDVLVDSNPEDMRLQCISHAYAIANVVRHGWNNDTTQAQIKASSELLSCSETDTFELIEESVKVARSTLQSFYLVDELLPLPWPDHEMESVCYTPGVNKTVVFSEADHRDLRNRLLRQLTHMLNEKIDLNRVMFAVLEGIKVATFCDQTFIMLYNAKTKRMFLHQHIGAQCEKIAQRVLTCFETEEGQLLMSLLKSGNVCWPKLQQEMKGVYTDLFLSDNFFVFPLRVHEKSLGYIFAVRTLAEPELDDWDFEFFNHFCDHANVAFRLSTRPE